MISERHYDDETLIGLLRSRPETAARDPHLSNCSTCSDAVASYRAIAQVLGDDAVWDLKYLRDEPPAATPAMLRTAADAAVAEDAAAVAVIRELFDRPRSAWVSVATADTRYRTPAVIHRLVELAEDVHERDPAQALDIADTGVRIAQLLDEDGAKSEVMAKARSAAWRQYGFALFYSGRIPEASAAAARAGQALQDCRSPDLETARLAILESILAAVRDDFDQALTLARRSTRIFVSFGLARRAASGLHAEAYALMLALRYREALDVLIVMDEQYRSALRPSDHAGLVGNIALCYWNLGRIADALQQYQIASQMHEDQGAVAEAVRIRFNVAGLLASEGHYAEAENRLRKVHVDFAQLGMAREAVSASLIHAEVLLIRGAYPEVEALCREAISQFQRMGLASTAEGLTALTHLKEAAAQRVATPQMAHYIKDYVERLEHEPALLFAPPPPE